MTLYLPIHWCRLTSNQLVSALKVSLGGRNSSELSSEYEEFFLNNADDIADLLKKLPKSAPHTCTHFQAQQMVCSMIQVGEGGSLPSPPLSHLHLLPPSGGGEEGRGEGREEVKREWRGGR